ncbi:hypothetical protein VSR68_07150 [Paraburkholderia phymatum]|uniref:hypothetical protein n=1 Tax=Paraburkholderia phymatum TaxID=148447 RepID=UPI0031728477
MMKSEILTAIERRACGAYITDQLRRAAKIVKRTRPWAAFVSGPLTPSGYAILAIIVAAILLVAMLSTCWPRDGLDSVVRVGCWFS